MNKKEILEKAIRKAIDNGWDKFGKKKADWQVLDNDADNTFPGYEIKFKDKKYHWFCTSSDIIFSHDFAKALWGEDSAVVWFKSRNIARVHYEEKFLESGSKITWQYHLQQMVIAEDPIKYLGGTI